MVLLFGCTSGCLETSINILQHNHREHNLHETKRWQWSTKPSSHAIPQNRPTNMKDSQTCRLEIATLFFLGLLATFFLVKFSVLKKMGVHLPFSATKKMKQPSHPTSRTEDLQEDAQIWDFDCIASQALNVPNCLEKSLLANFDWNHFVGPMSQYQSLGRFFGGEIWWNSFQTKKLGEEWCFFWGGCGFNILRKISSTYTP